MNPIVILGQAATTANGGTEGTEEALVPMEIFWNNVTSLDLSVALLCISFGVVCLFYGWRVFKILVAISFGLLGLLAGIWVNKVLIGGNVIWLSVIFIALFSFLSITLMRWGVSILGAVAGGILTGGGWLAVGLPQQYIWAGGIVGAVAGFLVSFIIFKIAVMLFTSFGGSVLIVIGALAVAYKHMGAAEQLQQLVFEDKWFLPLIVLIPMVSGMITQYRLIKGTKNWSV
jgi:hypothetical protein